MRILMVTNFYAPEWRRGGVVRSVTHLSEKIGEKEDIRVITTGKGGFQQPQWEKHRGIQVLRIPDQRRLGSHELLPFPIPIGGSKKVREAVEDADIVHIHEHRSILAVWIGYLARTYNCPHIIQPHGSASYSIGRGRMKRIFDSLFGESLLESCDGVVAITTTEKKELIDFGLKEEKIQRIPNLVNLYELQGYDVNPAGFKEKYGIKKDEEVILSLGRLHPIKGLDILIKAYDEFRTANIHSRLCLVGPDDGARAGLEQLSHELGIADDILFTGPLYGEDKAAAFSAADCFVLPSRYEVFGNAVIEAMSMGLPVVISDRCGLARELEGPGCRVVELAPSAISYGIRKILDKSREETGKGLQESIRQKFDPEEVVRDWVDLYELIIAGV